ncbi:3-oxoacyl-[acyl-carrier-protein] reductase [Tissierella creatinophila]|uniref:3-oxoacyl-[acyl-carrier-protein] reductase n=1 Tax=Tissierella creatinophila DSM 6911 TaxID=1123403 RepID=A0A1U7M498_TISCR|nr:3-oxoacyl-[acyl-carrier-protein] reductase [Tissierella creatinophila]OLS02070.1 3-oxoacyl-[acyl-carrier-protein] reductase FabG [Tissierella creatinophila DSM 6911]
MNLKGKIALVTGASRGIGKEIALKLSEEGADIAFFYSSNDEKAKTTIKELEQNGVKAIGLKVDVSVESEVVEAVAKVEKEFGTIDILVNNAGITRDNLLIRMSEKDWDDVMDINLKGTFLTTKAVVRKMMKKRYGKIINISSIVGVSGNVGQGNYSASKAGIIGFTKSMAQEMASRGIRVNAIAPGFIETDMTDVLKEEVKMEMLKNIPLKHLGKPEDIANLTVFLASSKSDYITGQVININGGMGM